MYVTCLYKELVMALEVLLGLLELHGCDGPLLGPTQHLIHLHTHTALATHTCLHIKLFREPEEPQC